jgi:hypothetical protein
MLQAPRRERLVLKNHRVVLDGRQAQERAADAKEHTPPPREAASGGDGGVLEAKGEREIIEMDDSPEEEGEENDHDDDVVRLRGSGAISLLPGADGKWIMTDPFPPNVCRWWWMTMRRRRLEAPGIRRRYGPK